MNKYNLERLETLLEKYIGKENDKELRYNIMDELKLEGIKVDGCDLDDHHYVDLEDKKNVYFEKWFMEDEEVYFKLYILDGIIDCICMDKKEDDETILMIKK